MKGKDPEIAMLNQDKVVNKNACCKFSFFSSSRLVNKRRIPINSVIKAEDIKASFFSLYKTCTKNGISIKVLNIDKSTPMEKKIVL